MSTGPDYGRVVDVIVGVVLRSFLGDDDDSEGGLGANSGVLPRVD